jgi:hypothetical protein
MTRIIEISFDQISQIMNFADRIILGKVTPKKIETRRPELCRRLNGLFAAVRVDDANRKIRKPYTVYGLNIRETWH